MTEINSGFESLPPEYRQAITYAEEQLGIKVTPLQELVGGWSGATIWLVSVAGPGYSAVEHLVLKIDRKRPMSKSDEITRHKLVISASPDKFTQHHIPQIVFDRVEIDNTIAIFYSIAGQSLLNVQTLSQYRLQNQIEMLFSATNHYLLDEWNANLALEHIDHPQALLIKWLGFRLQPDQKIESFLKDELYIAPDKPGFIIRGDIYPNPLFYARSQEPWGPVRPSDAIVGLQHGDLNTNNILAKFTRDGDSLEGYYLIDFALFKTGLPLLYDQRYLEMSYLIHAMSRGSFDTTIDLITSLARHDILDANQAPVDMAGVNAAFRASRLAFETWVTTNHPSLGDDLWGQYWLAGAAAGMSYCHKAGQPVEVRLAGLIYAAANLKQYFKLFNLGMPTEASQLYSEAQYTGTSTVGAATRRAAKETLHNLPAPPTHFIGRESELGEIAALLEKPEVRLVTLTGPGGTGKTRLGLETGRSLLDRYADGVFFVDLAPITDPDLLATTTGHILDIREGGGNSPLETLKTYLTSKQILLIFDNFEQITPAAADLAEILAAAPEIKAITTSRIPLHLRGEQEYPVPPLDMPPDSPQQLDELLHFEAIALFQQQAQSVNPQFKLTEENHSDVVKICRRLDGLPLAIEICAARIKMLPPKALINRLDQSLKILVGGAKDLPDRQQTLRGTIDWSYQLLEPEVQRLFVSLSVFSGGFTLEAAEGVCNPDGSLDIFTGIETLLDSSLLRQVQSVTDEPRFDMLQTIREFALEIAKAAGVLPDLGLAHMGYYAGLAAGDMLQGMFTESSVSYLKRMEEEHDNYRSALKTTLSLGAEGILPAVGMLTPITWFWYRNGHLQEGREWTEQVLKLTDGLGDAEPRVMALTQATYLPMWSGDLNTAEERGREAVEMAVRLKFDFGLAFAKLGYGTTLVNMGQDKAAYPHLVDAVELFDDQTMGLKGSALIHLANVSLGLGETEQAKQWLGMALPVQEEFGDPWGIAFVYSNYGEVARANGELEKAEDFYRKTAEYYALADAKGDQARLVNIFGYLAMHKGEFVRADALHRESLEDFLELGNQRGIAECLAGLAVLWAEEGKFADGAVLLSAADRQLKAFGGAWWPADRVEIDRANQQMESALEGEFQILWARGQTMGVAEALAFASQNT